MKHVYLAGPYSHKLTNVTRAIEVAESMQRENKKLIVFVPHLYHYWSRLFPDHTEKHWLNTDISWLKKCDAVYRMAGKSEGAEIEVRMAIELRIPVFYDFDNLIKWSKEEK